MERGGTASSLPVRAKPPFTRPNSLTLNYFPLSPFSPRARLLERGANAPACPRLGSNGNFAPSGCDNLIVPKDKPAASVARRYFVRGRVQGVGFRYFVERAAADLGLTGYARNLEDGRVEVYAKGRPDKLAALSGLLWKGPLWSEVRGVEEQEAPMLQYMGFHIE